MAARYDFGIITNLGNVANPVNAQDAATKAYVDAQTGGGITITSPNATIAVGGTSTTPTLDIAQQGATTTQALVWNGTKFAPAAQSLKFDSFANISGNLVTLGSVASGTNIASFTGDVRSTFPNGLVFYFAGITTPYTVTATTFASSITDVQFTPNVSTTIASGTNIQVATKTPFTEVAAGSNITLSVNSNVLTITGPTIPTVPGQYSYDGAVNYSSLRTNNYGGNPYSFSGNVDTTNIGSVNVTFNATATDGSRPNITLSSITGGSFAANQSFFIFDPAGNWNITYAYLNGTGTQLAANSGVLNTARGNTIPIGTVANCIITGVEVVDTDLRNIRFNNQSVGASQAVLGLRVSGDTSNFTTETLVAGANTYWDTDASGNPRINAEIPVSVGKGWIISVGAGFDTTPGTYAGWSFNSSFPRFVNNGQVVLATGINSTTYLGNPSLVWTSNYITNANQVAQIWQAWNNSFSDALPITLAQAEDDVGRFTLHTAPLASGVNPTQTDAVVQGLFNVGSNPNAGSDYINSIAYDDASGTYEYQRAQGGAQIIVPTWNQVMAQGNSVASNTYPLILQDGQSSPNSVNIQAPSAVSSTYTIKLPSAQGSANQVLSNDGSGNLSWTSQSLTFDVWSLQTEQVGFAIGGGNSSSTVPTSLAFDNPSRTFSLALANGASSYDVWVKGTKYTVTSAQTVTLPNTSGLYYITFQIVSGALTLVQSTTPYNLETQAPVALIYWNANIGAQQYLGDERHWLTMDWKTHQYLHLTQGAKYASGFAISGSTTGSGTVPADAQIGISSGTFFDEDLRFDLSGNVVGTFQTAIMYKVGTAWVKDAPSIYPYKLANTNTAYNLNNAGTWSVADITNNSFGSMYVLATNDINTPFITIMGQAEFNSANAAIAAGVSSLDLSGLPISEFTFLFQLVFQTKTSFTTVPKANQVNFIDLRSFVPSTIVAPTNAVDITFRDAPSSVFSSDQTANSAWNVAVNTFQNPGAWLSGTGNPSDNIGAIGNWYTDTTTTTNRPIWLKTQTVTSPYWVRQSNFENTIQSYVTASSALTYVNVAAISTTNVPSISGLLVIDGYQTVAGDLVLLQNQTTASQNGIYTVASGAWTGPQILVLNEIAQAQNGTVNIGRDYIQTAASGNQTWALFAVTQPFTFVDTLNASTSTASRSIPNAVSSIIWGSDLANPFTAAPSASGYSITGPTGITIASGLSTSAQIAATGAATSIDLVLNPKGGGIFSVGSTTSSLQSSFGASSLVQTIAGSGTTISIETITKGSTSSFLIGKGTGFTKLSVNPSASALLLQILSTTGVTAGDMQFRALGSGSVFTFQNPDNTNSFSITPPNTTTTYNLFNFGSTELRMHTSATAGFTFGNLSPTVGTIATTAINIRSTASQAVVQTQGILAGGNYDLVLRASNSGNVIVGTPNQSVVLGTTAAYTTPLLAADALTPTTLSAGTSGQSLLSRGSGNTPYWGNPLALPSTSIFSLATNVNLNTGTQALNKDGFTTQVNGLNITTTVAPAALGNWSIPANSGLLKVTVNVTITGGAVLPYNFYFSLSTSNSILTQTAYGSGVSTGGTYPNSSGFTSSSSGGTPASTVILRPFGAGDYYTFVGVGYVSNSASAQTLYSYTFNNVGGSNTITVGSSTLVIFERVA